MLAVADWAAEDDKAIIDKAVHERRVPIPSLLLTDLTREIPPWAMYQPYREIGHGRSVPATTDTQPTSAWR
jgi:hypothetical protein